MIEKSRLWAPHPETPAPLGHENIAEFLAENLADDPNLHAAITGPWGSGKTRLLELTRDKVQEEYAERDEPDPLIFWYDPWRYSPDETTLRRTFLLSLYDAAEEEGIEGLPELDVIRFLTDQERKVEADQATVKDRKKRQLRSLWTSLKVRTKWILGIFLLFAAGFLIASNLPPTWPFVGLASTGFAYLSVVALFALVWDAIDLLKDLKIDATATIIEPKVDQIDQFEEEYDKLIEAIHTSHEDGRDIVVFIDDLDRCSPEEIRTVMTGLSTYLRSTDPTPRDPGLAFVVALDDTRVIEAYEDIPTQGSPQTENILLKTFHSIVPVPTPSNEDLTAVVGKTLEDMEWELPQHEVDRLAKLSVRYGEGNLRIIRGSLSEALWLREYTQDVLAGEFDESEKEGLEELTEDPIALYQVALIRLKSTLPDLREFLGEPAYWIGHDGDWPDSIPQEIFSERPVFSPRGLDPRPLLTLGQPSEMTHSKIREGRLRDLAGKDREDEFQALIRVHPDTTKIDIAHILSTSRPEDHNEETATRYTKSLLAILHDARDELTEREEDLFLDIFEHYQENNQINHDSNPRPGRWLAVGASISQRCLDPIVDAASPLMDNNHRHKTLNQLSDLAASGNVNPTYCLETELAVLDRHGEVRRSVQRTSKLFGEGKIDPTETSRQYLVTVTDEWDWPNRAGGPDEQIFDEKIVRSLDGSDLEEKARERFAILVNREDEDTLDFAKMLRQRGWPHDTESTEGT